MENIKKTLVGFRAELKKVVWPTPNKLLKNMVITIAMIVVMGAMMFGFDQVGQGLVKLILSFM